MNEVISSPLFGVLISLLAFELGMFLYKKFKNPVLNPLLVSIAFIVGLLLIFHIDFEHYNNGGQLIAFFLGPATVILAVPLYKKLDLLKANALPIVVGILVGSIVGITSIVLISHFIGLDADIIKSLSPKSVTVPIGVEVSKQLGGIPPITVVSIIITGIIGAIMGPTICKIFKIKDKLSIGVSIGTASHAVGTTKALELGEVEGAMSSLSIGIAGLFTVFLAPIIIKILNSILHFY